jgi:hypothetical protein
MAIVRDIPRRLLPHTIDYSQLTNTPRGESFGTPQSVEYVRVDIQDVFKKTQSGEELVGNALMFVSPKHSTLTNFKKGSRVEFNGSSYRIVGVEPLYGFRNSVHHWEVILK